MNILSEILNVVISLVILAGIVFLQRVLSNRHLILGLILPLLSLICTIITDYNMILSLFDCYYGPKTIEKYSNGKLISETVITSSANFPTIILLLIITNALTIALFLILFFGTKNKNRKRELAKMRIYDLK